MFFFFVFGVLAIGMLYLGWRLISPLNISPWKRAVLWAVMGLLMMGQRFVWYFRWKGSPSHFVDNLDLIGYVILGFISFVAILVMLRDIWFLGSNTARMVASGGKNNHDPERRRFLQNASNAAVLCMAAPAAAFSVHEAWQVPHVVQNTFLIRNLPSGLEGLTIAQITDTHIGPSIKGGWARKVVERVNSLNPDIVVHTGDMVDGGVSWLKKDVAPFADLRAPLGKYFCTGNHEYYSGVQQWLDEVGRLGFRSLENSHVLIEREGGKLLLGGVTDYRADRFGPQFASDPFAAIKGAADHDASLLLAHRPRSVFEAEKAGFDMQISGHTHGGQFFPWTLVIHWFQPYVRGLYQHGGTQLYVSAGTGFWGPPMRLGTAPEITLHTLKRA